MVGVEHVGLGVRAGNTDTRTEVLQGLSASSASQQYCVLAVGRDLNELVETQALAAGLQDFASRGLGELQGANSDLRHLEQSFVVEDLSDDDQDLALLVVVVGVLEQLGDGDGVSRDSALTKSLVDDFVERHVGSSGEELVQLDQKLLVLVAGGGFSGVSGFDSTLSLQVYAH